MKILVICQYYAPEPFRISDICEELVRRGHEVSVVTGIPNYPEGKVYPGFEHGTRRDEVINGVHIHRCWTIPRKTGTVYRLLNYFSYPLSSSCYVRSKKCCSQDGSAFDVVFVNQLSPVMMAAAGIAYKTKMRVPVVLYCLDLWPESLTAGGVRQGSVLYRAFHRISSGVYRKVDRILVTSRMFTDYLKKEFNVKESRMAYLPQYAEDLFQPMPSQDNGVCDLVFAGNVGAAQGVDTILHAATLLKNEQVRFHIVGSGTELERLKTLAQSLQLDNVVFYGRRPVEEMPDFYAMADAMLVTLKADPVLSLTLPGKVQSYMAAGKPIIGAIDGETAEVIREAQCGYCGRAGDAEQLAENIKQFIHNTKQREFGKRANEYYQAHFIRGAFLETLERELMMQ